MTPVMSAPCEAHRSRHDRVAASLTIFAAALLWGTLWIPLRELRAAGSDAGLLTAAGFLIPLVVLFPAAVRRWAHLRGAGPALPAAGFGLALAIALYAEGVVRGSVARVVLLFYLMPVWTTLLARVYRSQPITPRRVASIGVGLGGLAVIYGPGVVSAGHNASADWMGLVAGMAWAATLVLFLPTAGQAPLDHVFAQFVFLAPVYLVVSALPGAAVEGVVGGSAGVAAFGWLLAFSLIWMLPVVWLTISGASRVEPGHAAVLFMLEIAVALASAALLAGEPFGMREGVGAALIAWAGILEVLADTARPHGSGKGHAGAGSGAYD